MCLKIEPKILNYDELATSREKKDTLSILEHGLKKSLPKDAISDIFSGNRLRLNGKNLELDRYSSVNVVSIGKSADLMAKVVNERTRIRSGIVVIPEGMASLIHSKRVTVIRAGHPVPTKKSVLAAHKILQFLNGLEPTALVMFLISGGTSSLVSLPDGISLGDKQRINTSLIKSGASIKEINCVRKHLSQVKGGRLIENLACHAVSLVMSDVVGDDLSVIASGITYCDKSTFSDAKRILLKYDLRKDTPKPVWDRILMGEKRLIPETPKKPRIENHIILTNRDPVVAMRSKARKLGYKTRMLWPVYGDVRGAALKLSKLFPLRKNSCIVFGGETTVKVTGRGKGGRNQELVLHILKKLQNYGLETVVASVGTDGIDGNTKAAGGIMTSGMPQADLDECLEDNNSFYYMRKYDGAIFTGHTHTNLMDIGVILRK